MGKWALLSAQRYFEKETLRPHRADGRARNYVPRQRSATAIAKADSLRAARYQPRWPRAVGFACMLLAAAIGLTAGLPMAPHGSLSSADAPSFLTPPSDCEPAGLVAAIPSQLTWHGDWPNARVAVEFSTSDYQLVQTVAAPSGQALDLPVAARDLLTRKGVLHWRVVVESSGLQVRGPLRSLRIR